MTMQIAHRFDRFTGTISAMSLAIPMDLMVSGALIVIRASGVVSTISLPALIYIIRWILLLYILQSSYWKKRIYMVAFVHVALIMA
jgi:hypothetical protein